MSLEHDNPVSAPWVGPFGGVPPLGSAKVEHLAPALERGMREHESEIDRIARNPEPPTFENTLVALERAGDSLERAGTVFAVLTRAMSTEAVQAIEAEMEPKLARHNDIVSQNEELFARIATLYERRNDLGLSPEQLRLLGEIYKSFVRDGAKLDPDAKRRLSEINQRRAALYTSFSQNVLKAEKETILVSDAAELRGLPQSVIEAAACAAAEAGHANSWAILNTRSSVEPVLTYAESREARRRAWEMFVSRGERGESDNTTIIREILSLRAEAATLLGYPTHAHFQLEDSMARTPERAMGLMASVWAPALRKVREELLELQEMAHRDDPTLMIEPWDYRYYQEKVRAEKYDLNESEITNYLQLERLQEGLFHVAHELFDLRFRPLEVGTVPVHHPDVHVWEVLTTSGEHVGLFYLDPFAREGKTSGAWMSSLRDQHQVEGCVTPIVSNDCNFLRGGQGKPTLLSWDDASTLLHEFGHALHGLCSKVTYQSLSGTNVPADFVELPSQILEQWLFTPEFLGRFARHHVTGEPMPQALVERIEKARRFNEGFRTLEYLASAIVDMKLHLAGGSLGDIAEFERATLADLGMPKEVVMRHRLPHFGHIFSGDSYSAGYYSYLWADTLAADAWEAFTEAGGAWDKGVAARFREYVLSSGNTRDPAEAYRLFRGRDAGVEALMRKRGFV